MSYKEVRSTKFSMKIRIQDLRTGLIFIKESLKNYSCIIKLRA